MSQEKMTLKCFLFACFFAISTLPVLAQEPVIGKSIIGTDDRRYIMAPETSIFSPVGMVLGVWSDEYGICTGTLIAPDVIITAAHCITDRSGNWAEEVYFAPSLTSDVNDVYLPFSYALAVDAVLWYDDFNDLAFVKLDVSFSADVGYYDVITVDEIVLKWYFDNYGPLWGYNAGYPTDKDMEMWYSECSLREWLPYYWQMGSDCDSLEGSSGSPFIVADYDGYLYVVGVLNAQVGTDYAWAGYGYSYKQAKNLVQPIFESYYNEAMSQLK